MRGLRTIWLSWPLHADDTASLCDLQGSCDVLDATPKPSPRAGARVAATISLDPRTSPEQLAALLGEAPPEGEGAPLMRALRAASGEGVTHVALIGFDALTLARQNTVGDTAQVFILQISSPTQAKLHAPLLSWDIDPSVYESAPPRPSGEPRCELWHEAEARMFGRFHGGIKRRPGDENLYTCMRQERYELRPALNLTWRTYGPPMHPKRDTPQDLEHEVSEQGDKPDWLSAERETSALIMGEHKDWQSEGDARGGFAKHEGGPLWPQTIQVATSADTPALPIPAAAPSPETASAKTARCAMAPSAPRTSPHLALLLAAMIMFRRRGARRERLALGALTAAGALLIASPGGAQTTPEAPAAQTTHPAQAQRDAVAKAKQRRLDETRAERITAVKKRRCAQRLDVRWHHPEVDLIYTHALCMGAARPDPEHALVLALPPIGAISPALTERLGLTSAPPDHKALPTLIKIATAPSEGSTRYQLKRTTLYLPQAGESACAHARRDPLGLSPVVASRLEEIAPLCERGWSVIIAALAIDPSHDKLIASRPDLKQRDAVHDLPRLHITLQSVEHKLAIDTSWLNPHDSDASLRLAGPLSTPSHVSASCLDTTTYHRLNHPQASSLVQWPQTLPLKAGDVIATLTRAPACTPKAHALTLAKP